MEHPRTDLDDVLRPDQSGRLAGWVLTAPGGVLADRLERAVTRRARAKGLLGRPALADGNALLIAPCRQVHTFGMRFAIDVVFCDRDLRVLFVRTLRSNRLSRYVRRAWCCIELPAGRAGARGVEVGSRLSLEAPS